MILDNYSKFLNDWTSKIANLGINTTSLSLDHLGYSVSSQKEYDKIKKELLKIGVLVREVIISERRVGVFKLDNPLNYEAYQVNAIELIEPKKDEDSFTGFEHGEFTIKSFDELLDKYPNLPWDTSNTTRKYFPRLKLVFDNRTELKFNLTSILK